MHGRSPERHWIRENLSILFWGVLLPACALIFAWPTRGGSLLLFGAHAALFTCIAARGVRTGLPKREARVQAFVTVIAKLPQAIGQLQFTLLRLIGRRRNAIDWRVAG